MSSCTDYSFLAPEPWDTWAISTQQNTRLFAFHQLYGFSTLHHFSLWWTVPMSCLRARPVFVFVLFIKRWFYFISQTSGLRLKVMLLFTRVLLWCYEISQKGDIFLGNSLFHALLSLCFWHNSLGVWRLAFLSKTNFFTVYNLWCYLKVPIRTSKLIFDFPRRKSTFPNHMSTIIRFTNNCFFFLKFQLIHSGK